jgi:hypothetical protein
MGTTSEVYQSGWFQGSSERPSREPLPRLSSEGMVPAGSRMGTGFADAANGVENCLLPCSRAFCLERLVYGVFAEAERSSPCGDDPELAYSLRIEERPLDGADYSQKWQTARDLLAPSWRRLPRRATARD